jgi:ABC-type multidrug transport system fused ATPase/permease subunit
MHASFYRLVQPILFWWRDFLWSNGKTILMTFAGAPVATYFLSESTNFVIQKNYSALMQILLQFSIGIWIYFFLILFVRFRGLPRWKGAFWRYIHAEYLKKVCEMDLVIADSLGSTRLFSLIDKGGQAWLFAINTIFEQGLRAIIIAGPFLYLIAQYSLWYIAWISLFIGCCAGIIFLFIRHTRPLKKQNSINIREYDHVLMTSIISRMELLSNNGIQGAITNMDTKNIAYTQNFTRLHGSGTLIFQVIRMMIYGLFILVLWAAYPLFASGTLTTKDLLLLTGFMGVIVPLAFDMFSASINISDQWNSAESLFEYIDAAPRNPNLFEGKEVIIQPNWVLFSGVDFAYTHEKDIIQHLDFHFEYGKIYALVWPSWQGKTTLLKLAAGLLQPKNGAVLLGGNDTKQAKMVDMYQHTSYLPQDPYLFDATIYENLTSGIVLIDDAQIREALTQAQAEFIYDFPQGLHTIVGERGIRLSGWQKQRIALAKVFLKQSNFIFLDEPTSALDSVSELHLTDSLLNLFRGKTVVISAHRLKTVQMADCICVVQSGKIVESGSHDVLLAKNGHYAQMIAAQSHF